MSSALVFYSGLKKIAYAEIKLRRLTLSLTIGLLSQYSIARLIYIIFEYAQRWSNSLVNIIELTH
jgi:hypothetical protein